jgi:hypothetical protein
LSLREILAPSVNFRCGENHPLGILCIEKSKT